MKDLIKEILKDKKFKDFLMERLAEKVADEYHFEDTEGELIKREIRELIRTEAKEMIKEVVEEYYEMDNIKTQIEKTLKEMTKKEILDLLVNLLK